MAADSGSSANESLSKFPSSGRGTPCPIGVRHCIPGASDSKQAYENRLPLKIYTTVGNSVEFNSVKENKMLKKSNTFKGILKSGHVC